MTDITLFNDSSAQMSVMALGKAINWNPKTTLNVFEKEAEILLKYGHVKKYDEISSDGGEKVRILEEENKVLKDRVEALENELKDSLDKKALKAKVKDIKTEELAKSIEGK